MTFLLILGVFIALAIINICIGFRAAIKLAPTIAQINTTYTYKVIEREWVDGDGETRWTRVGWHPTPVKDRQGNALWQTTGKTKGEYEVKLNQLVFKDQMAMLRFLGIFYIPVVSSRKNTMQVLEAYDPEMSKAKQAALQQKIDELEASDKNYRETGILT